MTAINVDTGDYSGIWLVNGQTAATVGSASIDLPSGTHTVRIASAGFFGIVVEESGNIISNNAGAATGGDSSLTFNTIAINVDPGQFIVQDLGVNNARWGIAAIVAEVTTVADVVLVKGLRYQVKVGTHGVFIINLDEVGTITVDNGASANVSGSNLTFNTFEINIDPAGLLDQSLGTNALSWGVPRVNASASTGGIMNLVPGIRYGIQVSSFGIFFVDIDAAGIVSVVNGVSANGGDKILTFNTAAVAVDPGEFVDEEEVEEPECPDDDHGHGHGHGNGHGHHGHRHGHRGHGHGHHGHRHRGHGHGRRRGHGRGRGHGHDGHHGGHHGHGGHDADCDTGDTGDTDAIAEAKWGITDIINEAGQQGLVNLVLGLRYEVNIATNGSFFISVGDTGLVVVENGVSASGGESSLIFNTQPFTVDPGTYADAWSINQVLDDISATQVVDLVPSIQYALTVGGETKSFTVADDFAISPASITFALGTFTLSSVL